MFFRNSPMYLLCSLYAAARSPAVLYLPPNKSVVSVSALTTSAGASTLSACVSTVSAVSTFSVGVSSNDIN